MNTLILKCEYKPYLKYRIDSFTCPINDCTVYFFTQNTFLFIKIEGNKNSEELINLLSDIESLLFIYFGSLETGIHIFLIIPKNNLA